MAANNPADIQEIIDSRLKRLEEQISALHKRVNDFRLINFILSGVTLAGVVSFAFWLGGLNSELKRNTAELDKLNNTVKALSDKLIPPMAVVETKIENLDRKIDRIDDKLTGQVAPQR
ncbi:MAG TPA: hypothetical protein VF240_13295 [Pyrinomonadaceae bacterium]